MDAGAAIGARCADAGGAVVELDLDANRAARLLRYVALVGRSGPWRRFRGAGLQVIDEPGRLALISLRDALGIVDEGRPGNLVLVVLPGARRRGDEVLLERVRGVFIAVVAADA